MASKTSTVIPSEYLDLLNSTALAHIATLGPKGEPQVSPVWFEFDGEFVRFSQTKTRQKLHNLDRDPRIALSIVDPQNDYRYIEVRGVVERVDEDPDNAFIDKMANKYLGHDKYQWHQPGDERVVVNVRPTRVPGA